MFEGAERQYVETAPLGRLATADTEGRPHVVPVCFAFVDDSIVTPIDEKPQRVPPDDLRRIQNITDNPRVVLLVDHYTDDWSQLGWVQIRGTATYCTPDDPAHASGVTALEEKYNQYAEHDLTSRPIIHISPGSIQSWGCLTRES